MSEVSEVSDQRVRRSYASVVTGIDEHARWRCYVSQRPGGDVVQLVVTHGYAHDLTMFLPYTQIAALRAALDGAQADLDRATDGRADDADVATTALPVVDPVTGRAVDPVVEAVDLLFRWRHHLAPDVLRSLADVWTCGSAARYGRPHERFWEIDADLFTNHDVEVCEDREDGEDGTRRDGGRWSGPVVVRLPCPSHGGHDMGSLDVARAFVAMACHRQAAEVADVDPRRDDPQWDDLDHLRCPLTALEDARSGEGWDDVVDQDMCGAGLPTETDASADAGQG